MLCSATVLYHLPLPQYHNPDPDPNPEHDPNPLLRESDDVITHLHNLSLRPDQWNHGKVKQAMCDSQWEARK